MDIFGLTSRSLDVAGTSMTLISRATSATASNIANADTPYFKASGIDFESAMKQAITEGGMVRTDARHLPSPDLGMLNPPALPSGEEPKLDGNNVNMDREIIKLNEMNVKYSAYATVAGNELGRLKSAVSLSITR